MDRFDLGAYRRPISTSSAQTQRWFDVGLNWCYGFNHDEGIKCFEKALETDPDCAMAHWGIAYAAGPFYNLTWKEHGKEEADQAARRCFEHVRMALDRVAGASAVERRLIEALATRFQEPRGVSPAEFERWDDAYAAAASVDAQGAVHSYSFLHEQVFLLRFQLLCRRRSADRRLFGRVGK